MRRDKELQEGSSVGLKSGLRKKTEKETGEKKKKKKEERKEVRDVRTKDENFFQLMSEAVNRSLAKKREKRSHVFLRTSAYNFHPLVVRTS